MNTNVDPWLLLTWTHIFHTTGMHILNIHCKHIISYDFKIRIIPYWHGIPSCELDPRRTCHQYLTPMLTQLLMEISEHKKNLNKTHVLGPNNLSNISDLQTTCTEAWIISSRGVDWNQSLPDITGQPTAFETFPLVLVIHLGLSTSL